MNITFFGSVYWFQVLATNMKQIASLSNCWAFIFQQMYLCYYEDTLFIFRYKREKKLDNTRKKPSLIFDVFTRIFSMTFWSQFKFVKGSCLCQRNILNLTNAQTVFANFLPSPLFLLRQHDHFLYLEVCAMKCIHCREETLKIQLKKGTTLLSASKVTANSNINSITRIVMLLTQNKKISAKA